MIPRSYIAEWQQKTSPWISSAQVEQDLILTRLLLEIYQNPLLRENLAFRGGTALQKMFLEKAARYSEDLDFVQIHQGPIGPIMTALRKVADPILGKPKWKQGEGRVTLYYKVDSEIPPIEPMKIKIEINTREHFNVLGLVNKELTIESQWVGGTSFVTTYYLEELLATKLRALYQRKKGRDLFDFSCFMRSNVDWEAVVNCFRVYLNKEGQAVTRAMFEENFVLKMDNTSFCEDIFPLLTRAASQLYNPRETAKFVFRNILSLLPGDEHQRIKQGGFPFF